MPKIFISYRRNDEDLAVGRIYEYLVHRYGEASVYMDVKRQDYGSNFLSTIEATVASSDVLIAAIGRAWLPPAPRTRDYVIFEIATALERGVRIIPILIGQAEMPNEAAMPSHISDLSFLVAIRLEARSWHSGISDLTGAIEAQRSENASDMMPEEFRVLPTDLAMTARSPHADVRIQAARKIGDLGNIYVGNQSQERLRPALERLARDVDPRVVRAATNELVTWDIGIETPISPFGV
jgi:TIR domain-containing protein